jgi:hypothetical protein
MYTNALVKIFRIPDAKKSFTDASQTGEGGVSPPSIFDKLPAVGDRRIIGDSDLRGLGLGPGQEVPQIYNGENGGAGAGIGANGLVNLQERILGTSVKERLAEIRGQIDRGFIRENVFTPVLKGSRGMSKTNYYLVMRDAYSHLKGRGSSERMNHSMNGVSAVNNLLGAHVFDAGDKGISYSVLVQTGEGGGIGTIRMPFKYSAICAQFNLYKTYLKEKLGAEGKSVSDEIEAIRCGENENVGTYMMKVLFGIMGYGVFRFSDMFAEMDQIVILRYLQLQDKSQDKKIFGFLWKESESSWVGYKNNGFGASAKTNTYTQYTSGDSIPKILDSRTMFDVTVGSGELKSKMGARGEQMNNLFYIKQVDSFVFDKGFIELFPIPKSKEDSVPETMKPVVLTRGVVNNNEHKLIHAFKQGIVPGPR